MATQQRWAVVRPRGSAWVLAALLLPAVPASAHRLEKHFTVQGRPLVSIRNPHGRIEVKSWKKAEVVVVSDYTGDKLEVDTEQAGNRIEARTHTLTEELQPADFHVDYVVTLPEESELQIHTDSGSIAVERVYGDMTFDTVAADVQLSDVGGYLVVKTIGGGVVCRRCLGRIEVSTISGNVQLLQPHMENVRVQTSTGDILFDGDFLGRGSYLLKNYSGLIEVRFSETDSFDLTANSLYGNVENQARLKPDKHGRRFSPAPLGKTLFGSVNEGHAKVELSSFNGTIKIRKR